MTKPSLRRRISATTALSLLSSTLFVISPPKSQADPQTQPLTLRDAIRFALERSPELDASNRASLASGLERKNSASRILPSVDFTATHGIQDSSPSLRTTPWTSRIGIGLTENLYDNGRSLTRVDLAGLRQEEAAIQLQKDRNRICRDVALEFFAYSLSIRAAEIQTLQYDLLKKQYDLVSQQFHQGIKTKKDYLRFKAQLSRAEIDQATTKNSIEAHRSVLRQLLAAPDDFNSVAFAEDRAESEDMRRIPLQAPDLSKHYDQRLLKIRQDISENEVKLVQREYWPRIDLQGGVAYEYANYLGSTGTGQTGWNALATLSYNLWDWGIRKRDVMIAEHRGEIANDAFRTQLLATRNEIEKLMIDLDQTKRNYLLSQELLGLEKSSQDLLQTEYRNGKVSYLDLITAVRDFSDAQLKYYTALYDLKRGLILYAYHEGTLYDSYYKN